MYSQGWGRGGREQSTGWSQGTSHEWSSNRGRGNVQQQRGQGSRGSAYQRAGWTTSAGTRGRTDRGRGTWNTWSSRPYRGGYQGSTTKNSSEITVGYNFEGKLVGPERSATSFGEFKVCKICNVKTNSSVTAESHYSGKQHLRKLKELEQKKEIESKYNLHGEDMHCKLCNVSFTCVDQIEKHYGGARHKRNLDGGDAKKDDSEAAPDTGEDGDEPPTKKQRGPEQSASGGAGDDTASQKESEGSAEAAPRPPPKLYVCDVCNIKTTSQGLLDGHIEGKKHQRRLKQLNLPQPIKFLPQAQADSTTMADFTQFQFSPAELEAAKIVKFGPTGREKTFYKCDVCSIEDINSPTQYKQHMKSKKHQMVLMKKLTEAGVIQPQDLPSSAESNEPSYDPSFEPLIQAAKIIKPGRSGRERAFYKCDMCCIEDINSPTQFVQHLCNSKHQAALSKKEESNAVTEPQA
ncbi:zinc finger protein 385A-like [Diadema antillarum]|uniref:zinc finger protein 385A-like n=1 Tax=Diadema antillarum TaxID=105358 RepID=UPI003A8AEF09